MEKFEGISEVPFDFWNLRDATYHRTKFDKLINECVNYELKAKYGLMAYSRAEYCVYKDETYPIGESS